MPGFCVNCGTPLTGPFCNKCGARAVAPSAPAQATAPTPPVQTGFQQVNIPASPVQPIPAAPVQGYQPVPAPVAAAPKSSGVGKVLLWVGGILLVFFMVGAAAAVYGVYWVKHKVTTYASALTGESSDSMKVVAKGDSCRLLSTAELQSILGISIEKSAEIQDSGQPGCAYYTNPAAFAQLQKMALAQAKRQSEEASKKPGPQGDNPLALLKDANQMEGIVKSLGMTQPQKDGQVFSFTVEHNFGDDAWSGMRLTEAAVPGFEEVHGVGDHAMIGAFGHAFYLKKGDVLITMSTMMIPDARVKGSAIGRRIISNL
ncbi:MAG TPA: zinc ribbon domain-containing protein [Candidatus Sulfotelmatobacter sp.]|nr:zinc ribbon domain-containing protein [Candidatus Sulfotelmatobacter sp.]